MAQGMSVTFLGTSSGGGPSETRNCSSIVLDVVGNGSLWRRLVVDCAEGTLRQFALQPTRQGHRFLKVGHVTDIFITHMHADHIMGIVTLLRNILGIPQVPYIPSTNPPTVNIYGPAGLRSFVRTNLSLTYTRTADRYAVHELLIPSDTPTPCNPSDTLHSSEVPGRDIPCDADGFWRDVTIGRSSRGEVHVQAGPIVHRDPCIGYIFHESEQIFALHGRPPRKLVILGDTSSTTALTPLVASTPGTVSLLVHEATDAHIPAHVDAHLAAKRTPAAVATKTAERGHSTPAQAGACAGIWGAERLVLNHIGGRFPAPFHAYPAAKKHRTAVLNEMARQATEAWTSARVAALNASGPPPPAMTLEKERTKSLMAVMAYDYFTVDVPAGARDLQAVESVAASGPSSTKRRRQRPS